jgi:hypothetical protein
MRLGSQIESANTAGFADMKHSGAHNINVPTS